MTNLTISDCHKTPDKAWFAIAGAGSDAVADLLRTPGASNTILGVDIPYSPGAMTRFLGQTPESFCCFPTAWKMAQRAKELATQALETSEIPQRAPVWGFACTGAIGTNREKKGGCRAYLAAQSDKKLLSLDVTFNSSNISVEYENNKTEDADSESFAADNSDFGSDPDFLEAPDFLERFYQQRRAVQERAVSDLLLYLIRYAFGLEKNPPPALPGASAYLRQREIPESWLQLIRSEIQTVPILYKNAEILYENAETGRRLERQPFALFPGSFNPLHSGHEQMRQTAQTILGCPVWYELSVHNADKPPLSVGELAQRLNFIRQSADRYPDTGIILTNAPYFIQKARLFPKTTFVVGADTIERLGDIQKYYRDADDFAATMDEFRQLGARFLVFGRIDSQNQFREADAAAIPECLKSLCQAVPGDQFRSDLSSTAIRSGERGKSTF